MAKKEKLAKVIGLLLMAEKPWYGFLCGGAEKWAVEEMPCVCWINPEIHLAVSTDWNDETVVAIPSWADELALPLSCRKNKDASPMKVLLIHRMPRRELITNQKYGLGKNLQDPGYLLA